MPVDSVSSLAKKAGTSVDKAEELWKKAKAIVDKEYKDVKKDSDKYYQLVVGVLKKSLGITECIILTKPKVIESHVYKEGSILMEMPHIPLNGNYVDLTIEDYIDKDPQYFIDHIINLARQYKDFKRYVYSDGVFELAVIKHFGRETLLKIQASI
jgi:hypothetical protein